jgi:hypothetical protein
VYFPRRFRETYRRGLLLEGEGEVIRWQTTLRRYVGKMSALGAGRPLLLKSPGYTAQIRAIRALWPDARFIHIYRNPYVVFASTCRALQVVLRELALQPHEHVPVDEVVLDLYPQMMRRLLEEADRLPGDSIVHVRFEELERDPLGHIERIYRSIKLDDHEFARPRIEAYLRSIQHYTKCTHTFSEESVRRVTQAWQPFIAAFGYLPPDLERSAA